ncbi:MAG: CSLREA domain-containing protein, partial [Chloroflexi bacterium]
MLFNNRKSLLARFVLILALLGGTSGALPVQAAVLIPVRTERPGSQNSDTAVSTTIGDCPLFPENNIWNTRVDNLPVHARSDQWVDSIGRSRGFHMDFGTVWDGGPIGIPYNVVGSEVPKVPVIFDYSDESDPGPYPIPTEPLIEYSSDHHILIVDDTCTLYELFDAEYIDGQWHAGSGAIWDLNSNALREEGWTSADAAGLPILPGLVRYDEVMSGEINHAIRFTASNTNDYLWPARHLTSDDPDAPQIPPMGARFRLKASYDISGFSPELQVVLRAMKTYGIILADNGSNWYVSGAPNEDWDDDMLHDLDVLTGNDFEAVVTSGLMINEYSGATSIGSVPVTTTSDSGLGSLRQAIADAASGETIIFDPSLAGQTITLGSNLVIDKDLTIDGSGLSAQLTLSGGNIAHLEVASYSTVTISDLTITNGNYGILLNGGNLRILNSTLKDNAGDMGGAVYNFNGSVVIENSTLTQNQANYGGGAIYIGGEGHARIVNSTITQNQASQNGGGIFLNDNTAAEIINSTFAENSAPAGSEISVMGSIGHLTLFNTIFVCAPPNINCYDYPEGSVESTNSVLGLGALADFGLDILADNGGATQTMALLHDSPAINAGYNELFPATDQRGVVRPRGICDIGAYELVLHYVKSDATGANNGSSWTNAYTDLQSALSAASSGDEIWVAAGIYKPTTGADRTSSFVLKNGVPVFGGFAGTETFAAQRDSETHVTILSGDIGITGDNSDNSYHVVIGSNTDHSAILEGFTITGGNANVSPDINGGGMYNYRGSPTIVNVIFSGNSAAFFGGGMYNGGQEWDLLPNGSHPSLTNVIFDGNSAQEGGGMQNFYYSHPVLTNVTFSNNTATRAGGGMENFHYGSPTLTNVTFSGNIGGHAGGGISNWDHSDPTLTNVTFHANTVTEIGGGMANGFASNPTLKNVTINANQANQGGGIYNEGYTIISNSILYGNPGGEIYNAGGAANVTYSSVQGGYAGIGNLDADPLLGPLQDNSGFTQTMALGVGSPAIDAGDDVNCPATDQRGFPRPQAGQCDMGAYESGSSIVTKTADTDDGICGDDCSLREAITVAPNGGTITFAESLSGQTIYLASTLVLNKNVTIDGLGLTIPVIISGDTDNNGIGNVRVFTVERGVNVTLVSLEIAKGRNTHGAGIFNYGTLTVTNSTFSGNSAGAYGGGIYHAGQALTVTDSVFSGNSAIEEGGAIYSSGTTTVINVTSSTFSANTAGDGGAIRTGGVLVITNSTFYANRATFDGGVIEHLGDLTVTDSTFTGNSASSGGVIGNHGASTTASIANSTFSDNSAKSGGVIWNSGVVTVTNSTFFNNSASFFGGAIYNYTYFSMTLLNSTFANNSATKSGGGIYNYNWGTINYANTIIANSTLGGDCVNLGTLGLNTNNLVSDGSCSASTSGNPEIGPLADNGGSTQTMALLPGSPAIDAGDDTNCPATDQRGVSRPQDGDHNGSAICDIGAYEYEFVEITTHTIADFDGDGDTDLSVFKVEPWAGMWYVKDQDAHAYGNSASIPVSCDYNGDGQTDVAVYNAGTWYVEGLFVDNWGDGDSIPVPGDYDGDG